MNRPNNPEKDPFIYAAKPRSNTRIGRVFSNRGLDHAPLFPDEEIDALRQEHKSRARTLRSTHKKLELEMLQEEKDLKLLKALGESYRRLSSRQGAVRKALDSLDHRITSIPITEKSRPDVLVVDETNNGVGLTTTRPIIRVENIPGSLVIGGMTALDGRHALFMANQEQPEENFNALSEELDLTGRGGIMVIFSPGSNQEAAHFQQLTQLIGRLQGGFPNFNLYHQLYMPNDHTPNAHAQIDIRSMVASTNISSIRLDRPHRML